MPSFYHTDATLRHDAPCYVERQADKELYDGLAQGRFCYVLTSRQVGKSSLMVRTGWRLRNEGVAVATLDLQAFGQNVTADQWYGSLVSRIGRHLKLTDELEAFWEDNLRLGPMERWIEALHKVVLTNKRDRVVIFVDEIEITRGLSFSADEFFAGIRQLYTRRIEDDEMNRLTFCLLGASTPSDLIKDTSAPIFNIGKRIELTDFNEAEAAHLAGGLGRNQEVGKKLIKRIVHWTGGHPYLTQRLCITVGNDESVMGDKGIDRLCETLFLCEHALEQDDNLVFVRECLLRSQVDTTALLHKYCQILNNERLPADDTDPLIATLQLSGITKVENGCLKVRNRIYRTVFNKKWVESNTPETELQRQRAALRRGRIQVSKVAVPIILLIAFLAVAAGWEWRESKLALAEVERRREEAVTARADAEQQGADAERARLEARESEVKKKEIEVLAESQRDAQVQKALWQTDLLTWQIIKNDTSREIIKAFRDIKPHGDFEKEANQRIQELEKSPQPATNGAIIGQIVSQESESLAWATVTARNQDNGREWTMLSRLNGWFIIAPLLPGSYRVTIALDGYDKQSLRGLSVSADKVTKIQPRLQKAK